MNANQKLILEQLEEENPEALTIDGFDTAFIGVARRLGQPSVAAYDYDKCIKVLMKDMPYEEAVEYFDFNVAGTWMGQDTPIILERVPR